MNTHKSSYGSKTAIVAIASALILSGCSLPAASGKASPSKEASASGSELCIVNDSTMNMKVQWRGYPDERSLPPGGETCNSGYESDGTDVSASILYEPTSFLGTWFTWKASIENTWFFGQRAKVALGYKSQNWYYGICGVQKVGELTSMQADFLHGEVLRLPDASENAEYVVTLTDSSGENIAEPFGKCRF